MHWWDELDQFPLTLPRLPYRYDALEPWIDEKTMRLHHLGHQKSYMDKSNELMAKLRATVSAEEALKSCAMIVEKGIGVPEYEDLLFSLGGFVNHTLFWHSMSPEGGGAWSREFGRVVEPSLGNYLVFRSQFTKAAMGIQGSGWVWCCFDMGEGLFRIITSENQSSPLSGERFWPLFGLDVWEHAYYLRYNNDRRAYVDAFFNVINWPGIEADFESLFGPSQGQFK